MNKSELRTELRHRRRALSTAKQALAAEQLSRVFFQNNLHLGYDRIGLYWPNDGEIDPRPLAHSLLNSGKKCFLPILDPGGDNRLFFGEYTEDATLTTNRFGIAEPQSTDLLPASTLDLVLLPLVGFDDSGNRLGMGKGFYDRTLKSTEPQLAKPHLIGLAHECQGTDRIRADAWDVPMQAILTEERLLKISD